MIIHLRSLSGFNSIRHIPTDAAWLNCSRSTSGDTLHPNPDPRQACLQDIHRTEQWMLSRRFAKTYGSSVLVET
jgi:hypothetical protein